jgi:HAD superfamily hydrolase (TIGR01509 family)
VPIDTFLFDFDGLILDTETASRAGWAWLYSRYGHELPPTKWALMIGTVGGWDPWSHLEELVGRPLDRGTLNRERYAHELSLLEAEELRPGIAKYLDYAQRHGLKRAIVSSSSRAWIDMHLEKLERQVGWDAIATADHDPARAKPRPTLYLEALERVRARPEEAVAFEDSPNGAAAARAAGLFVVGVPNAITRDLGLAEHADLVVDSLADLPPDELLAKVT